MSNQGNMMMTAQTKLSVYYENLSKALGRSVDAGRFSGFMKKHNLSLEMLRLYFHFRAQILRKGCADDLGCGSFRITTCDALRDRGFVGYSEPRKETYYVREAFGRGNYYARTRAVFTVRATSTLLAGLESLLERVV